MTFGAWLEPFRPATLNLSPQFLEEEFCVTDNDKDAAWELYSYLITTILTQELPAESGDEATALDSVHRLFGVTRDILSRRGRAANGFARIAIVVLNGVARPFTASWHKRTLEGAFDDPAQRVEFRRELSALQADFRRYAHLLAQIAGVEDIQDMERL